MDEKFKQLILKDNPLIDFKLIKEFEELQKKNPDLFKSSYNLKHPLTGEKINNINSQEINFNLYRQLK